MEFRTTSPHFHQAAMATAFTLAIISPAASFAICETPVSNPLMVNIATESDDPCDDQVSLREAINYANDTLGKDFVTFANSLDGQTIEVLDERIYVDQSVAITGRADAELITLKASDSAPLFYVKSYSDRIDFDLNSVTIEKSAGTNSIIEMNGYGGDIVLDNIQTTAATHAAGIFDGHSYENEQVNNLHLILKNSHISGSTFTGDILETSTSWEGSDNHITIEDSTILNTHAELIAEVITNSDTATSSILIQRSHITGNTSAAILVSYANDSVASINVIESTISGNMAEIIALAAVDNGVANIDVTKSNISENITRSIAGSYSAYGSASINMTESSVNVNTILSDGLITSGTVANIINIEDSILCDNLDGYGGDYLGGQALIKTYQNTNLDISNSELCNNKLRAVEIDSQRDAIITATIENTIISNNSNEYDGAGIYANAASGSTLDLNIINSSIFSNKSRNNGGGIAVKSSDGSELNLNIDNSTLSNNQAGFDNNQLGILVGSGGGIFSSNSADSSLSIDITNATISHNISSGLGGGIGGISDSNIQIENSIIANNVAGNETDHDILGEFTISNSLIADLSSNNIFQESGGRLTTTINGTYIDQIGNGEGQTPDTSNNTLGQDPLLQPLALSGGTWVHQLSASSPAIGAGHADSENLPEFDQRGEGFARVRDVNSNPVLDMGAVQYFTKPVAVNDAISVEQDSENNSINVLANDAQNSDGLPLDVGSVTIMTHPDNGNADVAADGRITYTPNAEFFGSDRLIYLVQDIDGNTSSEAVVNITVEEVIDTIPEGRIIESSSGGGSLNLWLLSLFGLLGLRRKKS